ncbi:NAD-dependent epimerase/dehydratase family protein [Nioella aestuarii]|uniref:NAD-dependent epimerase/dehydratase family protein n=1 Tax=Nioella aestuarii TaxID=1662864 RepID=UPI003D7F6AC3
MPTVLVTGASGYIAKHIVLRLLRAGYHVRGSVRDPAKGKALHDALTPLLPGGEADTHLSTVTLDLLSDQGWREAASGTDAILHTASPFPMVQPKDPQDLIAPAVEGAKRAIRAAREAGVGRVILTSSVAAVSGCDLPAGRTTYDERDWSDPDYPGITAYSVSKTLAEKAAWDMVASDAPDIGLTTINPGFVIGAPLDRHYGTSLAVIDRLLAARDPMLPNFGFTMVDVGDIAEMHLRALQRDETIGQRLIGVADFLWFTEMADHLSRQFPNRKIVTRRAPDLVVRLLGLFDPAVRSIVPLLGVRTDVDASHAQNLLGMTFRDPRESLTETARWLIDQARV